MESDYISLQEATKVSGKSIRTIQRLAKKLRESEPGTISTRTNEKGIEEQTIDREVLLAYYPLPEEEDIEIMHQDGTTDKEPKLNLSPRVRIMMSEAYRRSFMYEDLYYKKEEELVIVRAQKEELEKRNLKLRYWLIGTITSSFVAFLIWMLFKKLRQK